MGSAKTRRRARRGDGDLLRDEIMAATERLLLRTGDVTQVSIRAIADEVGVTAPSIYMHFEDKNELVYEVCERHFQALDELSREAAAGIEDPLEALKAMGRAYVRFGVENPEPYRVCFMSKVDPESVPYLAERLRSMSKLDLVTTYVEGCMEAGLIPRQDAYVVACGLWAAVHGVASLLVAKPFFPWPDTEALIEHCLDVYCRGLGTLG